MLFIHSMGEPVAGSRWSEEKKKNIFSSRVASTQNLVKALHATGNESAHLILGSAIGIYGNRGDEELTEESAPGNDFLADVCRQWEHEGALFRGKKTILRTGVVLGEGGGALSEMLPLFENGAGGRLGSGQAWTSWIHLEDWVRAVEFVIENSILGSVNGVAPHPVKNREFTKVLSQVVRVPAVFPVPSWGLKVLFGEGAQVLLASQKGVPLRLIQSGFEFRYPSLVQAFQNILGWKEKWSDRRLSSGIWVNRKMDEVIPFFSSEKNLEKITPHFLLFHVLGKSTLEMEEGTLIDYRLKIHGFPVRWQTRISKWQMNPVYSEFVDEQISGPYARWHHTHGFEPVAGGTWLTDRVVFRLPWVSLGGQLALPWVQKDVRSIFEYRKKVISEIFSS
jgi:uncharacterized protein (TIGR01777 family)